MSKAGKRIAILSSHHGTGAAENLWLETALWLHQHGTAVEVAHCWNDQTSNRTAALRQAGIAVRALAGDWRLQRLGRALMNQTSARLHILESWLGKFKPDLVLVSQGNDHSSLPWLEALQQLRMATAVVSHGINDSDWPSDALAQRLRQAFAALRCSFWVSGRNAEDFQRQIGQPLNGWQQAFNPLKVEPTLIPWPTTPEPLKLACVARLQTRPKGHDLLLRAMAEPACRELPLELSFFGEGENRRGMQLLAESLGLGQRVQFHGHCNDLSLIWANHHLLAQPSRNEGMPLSMVEAMALGRPALATDVAGHGELVVEGVTGWLAASPSLPELTAALQRCWRDRPQMQAMGQRAQQHLLQWMPADPVAHFAGKLLELT